ncbi:MAG: hypothetical protein HY903_08430 [Deltaproteobacteria bacterium]|nr:hypothetical protein [Deltaproteobacteria bacterium]
MSVPSLTSCKTIQPKQAHGTLAAAKLPDLAYTDQAAGAKMLRKHGFVEQEKDVFAAKDGSWARLRTKDNRWVLGFGEQRFASPPIRLHDVEVMRYEPALHAGYAVSRLPPLKGKSPHALRAALQRLGFAEIAPGYFSHPDGSWLGVADREIFAGMGNRRYARVPAPAAGAPASPPWRTIFPELPFPKNWAKWRRSFAVARLPRANGQFTAPQLRTILEHLGFANTKGNLWTHPDGSFARISGPRITGTGFQRWDFGRFPYSANKHSNRWNRETERWLEWVSGHGRPPYPESRAS